MTKWQATHARTYTRLRGTGNFPVFAASRPLTRRACACTYARTATGRPCGDRAEQEARPCVACAVPLVHGDGGSPRSNDLFVVDQFVVNADRAALCLFLVFLARESKLNQSSVTGEAAEPVLRLAGSAFHEKPSIVVKDSFCDNFPWTALSHRSQYRCQFFTLVANSKILFNFQVSRGSQVLMEVNVGVNWCF